MIPDDSTLETQSRWRPSQPKLRGRHPHEPRRLRRVTKRVNKYVTVDFYSAVTRTTYLGSRVVSVLDLGAVWAGLKSQPQRCRVTVLGKLFTPIVPLFTEQRNWYQPS